MSKNVLLKEIKKCFNKKQLKKKQILKRLLTFRLEIKDKKNRNV
jgi:hypothetical protein